MITSDFHLHTEFSGDSTEPMEQIADAAVSGGLTQICFTDHMDIGYPESLEPSSGQMKNIFLLDVPAYLEKCRKLQEKYRGTLDIYRGIELGLTSASLEANRNLLQTYNFDFVIGSSHLIGRHDPYYDDFWEQRTEREAILSYFESILDNMRLYRDYDAYGHLDYIFRYTPRMKLLRSRRKEALQEPVMLYSYEEYREILDEILRLLLLHGKALEVNTGGYKYGLGQPNPQHEVLSRYLELGGELITIGSDAHAKEHVAYGFREVHALLTGLGFRYYTVYKARNPEFIPLE